MIDQEEHKSYLFSAAIAGAVELIMASAAIARPTDRDRNVDGGGDDRRGGRRIEAAPQSIKTIAKRIGTIILD